MKDKKENRSVMTGPGFGPDSARPSNETKFSGAPVPVPDPETDLSMPPRPLDASWLREFPLFRGLPTEALQELVSVSIAFELSKGEELRTPEGYVYFLLKGSVVATNMDLANSVHHIGERHPGYLCGELSALLERPASDSKVKLIAQSECHVARFPTGIFKKYALPEDAPGTVIARGLAESLAWMNQLYAQAIDVRSNPVKIPGRNFAERVSAYALDKIGTMRFLTGGVVFTMTYAGLNTVLPLLGYQPWDRYPYIFLNLLLSMASGATIPVLLISQKRQSELEQIIARASRRLLLKSLGMLRTVLKEIGRTRGDVEKVGRSVASLSAEVAALRKELAGREEEKKGESGE